MTRSIRSCGKRSHQATAPSLNAAFGFAVLLTALWAGPAAAAATSGGAHPESISVTAASRRPSVKYYIVPPPHNGQKAFLYEIAAQVLGNGNLYTEIFNLNKGRLQPDGQRMESPSVINPGWILILPADAHGPGVHFGPLPVTRPHRAWVKYYIVPPPRDGHKAFLFQIAAQVLGNGNLYTEIFNLNKGRLQPDGARMENPSAIDPGWILILPAGAQGPDVHFGPLPGAPPAGQQGTGGAWKSWILRALVGCLVLLGMILMVSAARAWLTAGRPGGKHRYGGARSHAAARAGRGVSSGGRRQADMDIAQSGDRGTGQPAHLPQTASMGASSPPTGPSPAAGHRVRQEPCPLPPATAVNHSRPQARTATTGPPLVTTSSPLGRDGRRSPPSDPAARDPVGSWGDGTNGTPFSPAALRLLGVRTRSAGQADAAGAAVLWHEVVLGDYRVQAVLAEAPASNREGRSPEAKTWVASTPYLVWTPLPHDVPDGGLAFACVGAGSEGCLFIDLAAAPGVVALGGEHEAATRLAESVAHQLCSGPSADRIHLVVVGDAVPSPHPPGMEWIPSVRDLGRRGRPSLHGQAELVFCRLNSNEDVLLLARYVASAPYRVVPLVLADLSGAPWSFTTYPSRRPAGVLQPVVS